MALDGLEDSRSHVVSGESWGAHHSEVWHDSLVLLLAMIGSVQVSVGWKALGNDSDLGGSGLHTSVKVGLAL